MTENEIEHDYTHESRLDVRSLLLYIMYSDEKAFLLFEIRSPF